MTDYPRVLPDGRVEYHPAGHSARFHEDCPCLACECERRLRAKKRFGAPARSRMTKRRTMTKREFGWDLPPGVRESDIPGNRPEDVEWDRLFEWLSDCGLSPRDIREAIEGCYRFDDRGRLRK